MILSYPCKDRQRTEERNAANGDAQRARLLLVTNKAKALSNATDNTRGETQDELARSGSPKLEIEPISAESPLKKNDELNSHMKEKIFTYHEEGKQKCCELRLALISAIHVGIAVFAYAEGIIYALTTQITDTSVWGGRASCGNGVGGKCDQDADQNKGSRQSWHKSGLKREHAEIFQQFAPMMKSRMTFISCFNR